MTACSVNNKYTFEQSPLDCDNVCAGEGILLSSQPRREQITKPVTYVLVRVYNNFSGSIF